jgi:CopG family transcriptional regulator, nickel-responsive regulator
VSDLVRQSFSIESSLWDKLEDLVKAAGYTNRSEFLRDMIRERLVHREWDSKAHEVVGTITMVYDHHARLLGEKLTDIQHDHHEAILATTHVHLDHDMCAEMIMMRGRADRIRAVADRIRQQKGVLHASLSISSTGRALR